MAKVSNTLIGKTRGSVGNVTFTVWKGRNVIKEKSNAPANPNTPLQQAQRARFKKLSNYAAFLDSFFVDVWSAISINVTHQNFLMKQMFPSVSASEDRVLAAAPQHIDILGKSGCDIQTIVLNSTVGANGGGTLEPLFSSDVNPLSVVARVHGFNRVSNMYSLAETTSTASWAFEFDSNLDAGAGDNIDVAVAFFKLDGTPVFAQVVGSSVM